MGPIYRDDQEVRTICREIMSLNLMPEKKIIKRFESIVKEIDRWTARTENTLLKKFSDYVQRIWISNTVWPPQSWSMFMQHRRTNNNAEDII